jgi:hypothetical protein
MSRAKNETDQGTEPAKAIAAENALLQARARRLVALKAAEGMWKDRTDMSLDGLKAQEQLRTEWH